MKAIVQTEYGSAEVLHLADVERPTLTDQGVLVRVQAAGVHAGDWHLMRGTPFLIRFIYGGLRCPQIPILGTDAAGYVEAVGPAVTQFQPGDAVFGDLSSSGFGAFAEYVCAPETAWVLKPPHLSFAEAATVPASALAALQGLRDGGQLQAGQQVLVYGAAGGVGSFAVQIAKAWGATVTGVCSAAKVEWVQALGADAALDYATAAARLREPRYDLIFDAAAYRPFWHFLPALTPDGTYVWVGGAMAGLVQAMLLGPVLAKLRRRRVTCLVSEPRPADLKVLQALLTAGKLRPCLDRCYPLSEVPAALRALEARQVRGKLAIQISADLSP